MPSLHLLSIYFSLWNHKLISQAAKPPIHLLMSLSICKENVLHLFCWKVKTNKIHLDPWNHQKSIYHFPNLLRGVVELIRFHIVHSYQGNLLPMHTYRYTDTLYSILNRFHLFISAFWTEHQIPDRYLINCISIK